MLFLRLVRSIPRYILGKPIKKLHCNPFNRMGPIAPVALAGKKQEGQVLLLPPLSSGVLNNVQVSRFRLVEKMTRYFKQK